MTRRSSSLYHAGAYFARDDDGPKQDKLIVCDFQGANSALLNAWPQVSPHETLSDAARLLILGHVWSETLFGASTGSMKGTNCWLSLAADATWMKKKGALPGFGRFLHKDKNQLNKRVHRWFRYYPSQYEAAKDYLEFFTSSAAQGNRLPVFFSTLRSGDPFLYAAYLFNFHCDSALRDCSNDNLIHEYGNTIATGKQDAERYLSSSCAVANYAVPPLPPRFSRRQLPPDYEPLPPIPPLPGPIPPIPPPGPLPPIPSVPGPISPVPFPVPPISRLSSSSLPKPTPKQGAVLFLGFSALLYATDSLFPKDHDS